MFPDSPDGNGRGKLRWKKDVFLADVETYRKRGIRHVTTFAAWIDADYKKRFGDSASLGSTAMVWLLDPVIGHKADPAPTAN